MNQPAFLQGQLFAVGIAKLAYFLRFLVEIIISQQDALFAKVIVRRIKYLRQIVIGVGDTAINMLVLLPKSSFKLQPDFTGLHIADIVDRPAHITRKLKKYKAQYRQGQRTNADIAL